MLNQPFHFTPFLKSVIWGGERIAPFKGITTDQTQIGESWELSAVPGHVSVVDRGPYRGLTLTDLIEKFGPELMGEENYRCYAPSFPLLIKIIDARADLSVQVHPDDTLAQKRHNCPGKTEMWHLIDTDPGAKIYAGLKKQLTPEEYEARVADNTIMDAIADYDSAPGDTFFLPAGRIHAIGAGNLLAEIQQTSDITYRIYDYDRRDKDGNPRELHTAQAKDAIDYTVYPDYRSHPEGSLLAECQYFDVRRLQLTGDEKPIEHPRDSFTIIMCLDGSAEIINTTPATTGDTSSNGQPSAKTNAPSNGETFHITRGETLLFPATMTSLTARGTATLLTVQS